MTGPEQLPSLSWRALEARIPLDELPAFHRAFLRWRGVEGTDELPLRRVQQRVEAELNRLVLAGEAQRVSGADPEQLQGELLVSVAALEGFAALRSWWP